ncbi:MAG: patatin family protein [Clostridia bacterium]|nr:patatin family protein [Clostridia bacterium]
MKKALVLEGGASRGYFSVGAMDVLMEQEIWLNYLIGASAGIANGVSYASKQIGRGYRIGTEFMQDPRYMGKKHLLNPKNRSLYNMDFVFNELPNKHLLYDYEALKAFGEDVYAVVTSLESGKAEYLSVSPEDKENKSILASCALPILFPPIEVNGKKYMDGGIADPIPVEKALKDGCEKAVVILTRERSYVKEEEKALGLAALMYSKYPKFADTVKKRTEIYNLAHQRVLDLERKGEIFVLAPEDTKAWGRTDSDPEKIKQIYNEGREVATKNLENLKKYLEK